MAVLNFTIPLICIKWQRIKNCRHQFFMIISYSSKLSEKKQNFKICEGCFLRFRADINSFRLNRNLQLCTTALPTPL